MHRKDRPPGRRTRLHPHLHKVVSLICTPTTTYPFIISKLQTRPSVRIGWSTLNKPDRDAGTGCSGKVRHSLVRVQESKSTHWQNGWGSNLGPPCQLPYFVEHIVSNPLPSLIPRDHNLMNPSGSLGAKLKTVEELMLKGKNIPFINENSNIKAALEILNNATIIYVNFILLFFYIILK